MGGLGVGGIEDTVDVIFIYWDVSRILWVFRKMN